MKVELNNRKKEEEQEGRKEGIEIEKREG